MIEISKGLYEVLSSQKISLEQKQQAVRKFARPIHYVGGEHDGLIEAGEITEEDAELICDALAKNGVIDLVNYTPGGKK